VLIIVMTLIQDSAFHTIAEKGVPIVFVNNDQDALGTTIHDGLKTSSLCTLHDSINGKLATEASARQAVSEGKFLIGVVIPKHATKKIKQSVSSLVSESMGLDDI